MSSQKKNHRKLLKLICESAQYTEKSVCVYIYIYIHIYIYELKGLLLVTKRYWLSLNLDIYTYVVHSIRFHTFLYWHLKLSLDSWKFSKLLLYNTGTLAQRLECSPTARETWVQSQVESYQRL